MGTNFYFFTQDRDFCEKMFPGSHRLTDFPDFGYEIHLAKTSCGWLPLFQSHENCKSVAAMKELCDTFHLQIVDENGKFYTWDEFDERVLQFNGGVDGVMPKEKVHCRARFGCPEETVTIPRSHFDIGAREWQESLFKDPQGYEFETVDFA